MFGRYSAINNFNLRVNPRGCLAVLGHVAFSLGHGRNGWGLSTPPIGTGTGPDFPPEDAAEMAAVREADSQGDFRQAQAGLNE